MDEFHGSPGNFTNPGLALPAGPVLLYDQPAQNRIEPGSVLGHDTANLRALPHSTGSKAADRRALYCPQTPDIIRFLSPSLKPIKLFKENWLAEGMGPGKEKVKCSQRVAGEHSPCSWEETVETQA